MRIGRTIAIWACGLIASTAIGGGIGLLIDGSGSSQFAGIIAGPCTFACARLWVSELRGL
jgi:hypothetical protein